VGEPGTEIRERERGTERKKETGEIHCAMEEVQRDVDDTKYNTK
jgi:hypothetical protein